MKFIYLFFRITTISFLLSTTLFAKQILTICGTGDNQELLRSIGKAYELENPQIKINIPNSIGSSGGIKRTAEGKCNLGRVARKIKKSEEKYNLNYILFSYSAVAFVTNQNIKKLSNLNEIDVKEIFGGKKKLWNFYDKGNTKKIYIVRREPSDSSHNVLKKNIISYKNIERYVGKILFSTPDAVNALIKYKNTIGYLPYSSIVGTNLNMLKYNNIELNEKNILNKSYNLVLPYGFVYKDNLDEISEKFINFIKTGKAKSIIRKHGAVPVLMRGLKSIENN